MLVVPGLDYVSTVVPGLDYVRTVVPGLDYVSSTTYPCAFVQGS